MSRAFNTTATYEFSGVDATEEALDSILNSKDQADACGYLLGLLNVLSGDGEIAAAARRGASIALVDVVMRGLEAIRSEGGRK